MKIRAKSETIPEPSRSVEHRAKQRAPLRATSLDYSERGTTKAFERAERRRRNRPLLSSTHALGSESKFIQATLHTMSLRAERPSHLLPRPRIFQIPHSPFVKVVVHTANPATHPPLLPI